MKFNRFKILAITCTVLTLLACNLLTQASGTSGNTTSAVQTNPPAQASASGGCSNPYYPVKQGATWTYKITGLPTGTSTFVDTITAASQDKFTDSAVFDNKLTRTSDWSCKPEGLLQLSLGNGAAAITSSNTQAEFTVTKSSGVTIPASISTGQSWTYQLDLQGKMNLQNNQVQSQGTANYKLKALGNESVTVPAGTFNAMKVQIEGTFNVQVSVSGINMPIAVTDNSTAWYAPGVGMVKLTDASNLMGQSINATTELQSYKIP